MGGRLSFNMYIFKSLFFSNVIVNPLVVQLLGASILKGEVYAIPMRFGDFTRFLKANPPQSWPSLHAFILYRLVNGLHSFNAFSFYIDVKLKSTTPKHLQILSNIPRTDAF